MKSNELHESIDKILEGVLDMPEGSTSMEQLEILLWKVEAAKRALGITNKLQNVEERKMHRSKIMKYLNQLRAMFNRVANSLEQEQKSDK